MHFVGSRSGELFKPSTIGLAINIDTNQTAIFINATRPIPFVLFAYCKGCVAATYLQSLGFCTFFVIIHREIMHIVACKAPVSYFIITVFGNEFYKRFNLDSMKRKLIRD